MFETGYTLWTSFKKSQPQFNLITLYGLQCNKNWMISPKLPAYGRDLKIDWTMLKVAYSDIDLKHDTFCHKNLTLNKDPFSSW